MTTILLRLVMLGAVTGALLGCDDSPSDPDPDPDPDPVGVDVDGFRIMRGASVVFQWHESDHAEADTLEMTWNVAIGVRFVWTGENGDSLAHPENGQVVVQTADTDFATWQQDPNVPYRGVFSTGGFPEVETSFRVLLVAGTSTLVNAANLVLHVSPP